MVNWLRTGRLPAGVTGQDGTPPMMVMRRAIAARLSDPWSAFAGWQPPHEVEREDGYRCLGREPSKEWQETVWRHSILGPQHNSWTIGQPGNLHRVFPTAFAPLPPTPTTKETTDG
jgi:hypothetical protein